MRVESLLYKANRARLFADGFGFCFICGSKEQLQAHHVLCPYAKQNEIDYDVLTDLVSRIDFYGYGRSMFGQPVTSVDDIRNLVILCEAHHKRADHGIHNVPFADWLMQKARKARKADES